MAALTAIGCGLIGGVLGSVLTGSITCVATWHLFIKPLRNTISDILEEKNIEKQRADAPQFLKNLAEELKKALLDFDKNSKKNSDIAKNALAAFLSCPESLCIFNQPQLSIFQKLFVQLQTGNPPIQQKDLEKAYQGTRSIIRGFQGGWTKVMAISKRLLSQTTSMAVDSIRHSILATEESDLHPLLKIRYLQERKNSPLKNHLICHYLTQLEFEDITIDTLDRQIKETMHRVKNKDHEGYTKIAQTLELDSNLPFSYYPIEKRDLFYVLYKKMRESTPLLSTPRDELQWKRATSYEKEKKKSLDLVACLGLFAIFKIRYGGDELTKRGFYQTLSRTHLMSAENRKNTILHFLKNERERAGTAWTPWFFDQYVFASIYLVIQKVSSHFITHSSFIKNIKIALMDSPTSSMTYFGEKVSRYFCYLGHKYIEWCRDYSYDMTMDTFLRQTLYNKQKFSRGNLHLDFFFSPYNLTRILQKLANDIHLWASQPIFQQERFLALANPILIILKQIILLPPRIGLQLLKLPASFIQWIINTTLMMLIEQILLYIFLFEKIDEVVAETLLDPSPYQFPLLEFILNNLYKTLEIIEKNSHISTPNHPGNHLAKRALKEATRTFIRFIKSLNSLSADTPPTDFAFFEATLPTVVDKVFETTLQVHKEYHEKEDLEAYGTEFLQALNFYIYNKYKPSVIEQDLIKRHQEVKEHLTLYFRKIVHLLTMQVSSEIISEDLGKVIEQFLLTRQESELPQLIQNYISQNKDAAIEIAKKSYLTKGLLIYLITRK